VLIRDASESDLAALRVLCAQLEYPATPEEIRDRLAAIAKAGGHRVLVAEAEGGIVGLAEVVTVRCLVGGPFAVIQGLVVLEGKRSAGVGARLVRACEDWARERGTPGIKVRTNVKRRDAHRFYEREGYARTKEQAVYRKTWNKP
jgi:GNAT superfamily N-acetyltransferase